MKLPTLSSLATVSLLVMLAGCGGGGDDADTASDADGAATAAAADATSDGDGATTAAAAASNADGAATAAAAASDADGTAAAPATAAQAVPVNTADLPALEAAVRAALKAATTDEALAAYGQSAEAVIEAQRQSADGDWVFGGSYFPIPAEAGAAAPLTSLFVAHRQAGGWVVALEDAADFAQTLQSAATELTSAEEKRIFATRADTLRSRLDAGSPDAKALAAGQDVGLSLPYRRNDASWGTWGVHGDSGTSRPYNSIDFKAGDGRVLASRGGVAYKFCTNGRWPFIKVVHDNGYTTGYYHLRNQPGITNGQRVAEGEFLGETGVELPCGGSASGNHVHWTLWRGNTSGQAESVEGKLIGGWVWHETNQAYGGYAERNGQRVSSGGNGLTNYGHGGETPSTPTTPTTPTKPTTPTPPSGNSPCTGASCKVYSGSIAQAGQFSTQPGDRGFQHTGGTLRGWLKGPAGANFGLILGKYNTRTGQWDRAWVNESAGSEKNLYYNAPAGTYRWRISAISGRGAYTLWTGK